jgi:hypothetical protein
MVQLLLSGKVKWTKGHTGTSFMDIPVCPVLLSSVVTRQNKILNLCTGNRLRNHELITTYDRKDFKHIKIDPSYWKTLHKGLRQAIHTTETVKVITDRYKSLSVCQTTEPKEK